MNMKLHPKILKNLYDLRHDRYLQKSHTLVNVCIADRKEKGILVADNFSKDCYAEVARIDKDKKIKIELRKIDDIFFKA